MIEKKNDYRLRGLLSLDWENAKVKCDLENNPPDQLDTGFLKVDISVKWRSNNTILKLPPIYLKI